MQMITKRFAVMTLSLTLFAAFICGLSFFAAKGNGAAELLSPAAAAAQATNRATISFFNGRGQEIGEGRPFPLDRVERGERFTATVSAERYPITIRVRAANGFQREVTSHTPTRFSDVVPTNPSFDNITVTVFGPNHHQIGERRLPIGRK